MQVNQLSGTYSNLARLSREAVVPPFQDQGQTVQQEKEARPDRHEAPASTIGDLSAEIAPLKTSQALEMADGLARSIISGEIAEAAINVHDLSGARLIHPRYV